jgi:hypothetical protein
MPGSFGAGSSNGGNVNSVRAPGSLIAIWIVGFSVQPVSSCASLSLPAVAVCTLAGCLV